MGRPVKNSTLQRGRPRSAKAKKAILTAARALLDEGGPGAVTMEAVAARAGVGKPTVYRWWEDRHAVAMAALMDTDTPIAAATGRRSALEAMREQLRAIASRFASGTGRHVATLLAAADRDSELSKAFRTHFVLARRSEGRALLKQAMEQGDVRTDVDTEVALDVLYGPIFFRLLLGHAPLSEQFVDRLLDETLRGMATTTPRRIPRLPSTMRR